MILGTSRIWYIIAILLFIVGLGLVASSAWDTLGDVGGVVLVILAMLVFAAAPMRYGRDKAPPAPPTPPAAPAVRDGSLAMDLPAAAPVGPPPARADIEARDASEV